MTGTEPAGSCFEKKLIVTNQKPLFCEMFHIFKSLYPDIVPSLKITLHCDDPEIDQNIMKRVIRSAYREYTEIMKEMMISKKGFNVCGTWDIEEGAEDAEM